MRFVRYTDRMNAWGRGRLAVGFLPVVLMVAGCAQQIQPSASMSPAVVEPAALVGTAERTEIESAVPEWMAALVAATPDAEAALRLADPWPGVEIDIFLGTWCSDSKRELTRFWHALDLTGGESGFTVRYVAVDREKLQPETELAGQEVLFVPTFIVRRDGRELGRVVETAPSGIEVDLLAIMEGRASGWISTRDDLPAVDGA